MYILRQGILTHPIPFLVLLARTSLSFSPSSLCEHSSSDHNYLGLCGILLAHSPMSRSVVISMKVLIMDINKCLQLFWWSSSLPSTSYRHFQLDQSSSLLLVGCWSFLLPVSQIKFPLTFRQSTEIGGRKAAVRQLEFLLEQELKREEKEKWKYCSVNTEIKGWFPCEMKSAGLALGPNQRWNRRVVCAHVVEVEWASDWQESEAWVKCRWKKRKGKLAQR